jgi:hypothetical protein
VKTVNNHKGFKGKACKHRWQDVNSLHCSSRLTQKYNDPKGFQAIDLRKAIGCRTFAYNKYNFDMTKGNLLSLSNNMTGKTGYFDYSHFNCLTDETILKIARILNVFKKQ